ncbi:MAG TPA: polysaccharide biosynthesis tyrosine autokinase [Vicinamibacterales bacterium]|jgi:capsular exopolysaccharide synthesis family protein|nr:polysaccharide biosynthesis tyrosine autokinase [Vicinamibacterales bacterium]
MQTSDQAQGEHQSESPRHLRLAVAPRSAQAAPSAPPVEQAEAGGHLLDYVRVLHKRRWTAATAFLLVVVSVTTYTFTVTPIYEAGTRLLIESDDPNIINFTEVIDEQGAKADYYQTQYNILKSRALARKTVEGLQLWQSPYFGGGSASRGMWAWLPFGGSSAERQSADETMEQSHALDRFLENLTIAPIRNSRLVDLKYRLSDPELATRIINATARNYIEQNLEYKFLASKEANDWLGERLAEQRQQVEKAEAALQKYREQNDAISLEDRENIVVQKLADLNAAVTQAKTERFQKQSLSNQLQSLAKNGGSLDTFPAILSNSYIQQQKAELAQLQSQQSQLSEKLGEKHPDIVKVRLAIQLAQSKLDGEIAKVVQSVRNEYQSALAKENSLIDALNQQKGEAMSMNRKAIDYGVLERDVQSNKQIYESLLQRAKETGVSTELKTSNIRVVDEAERPRVPASPHKLMNLSLALLGGTFFAVGLAFFFEYVDSRIKTPDEITQYLGLPSLGMVPALDPKTWQGGDPLISSGVPPGFAEAIRSIRTNILFSSTEEGVRTLVVTSTGPGEGKTMIATNLAIGFAQAGQRVLLIDADMRRPRVHEMFRQKQEPGLSNLMVGHAPPSACIRKSSVAGLWLLTAGRTPPNPAELLGSQRFKDFIGSLGEHFDSVIIDSPPAMAVTDAAIAASTAGGIVFVIGAEMTSRQAAKAAIQQLENAQRCFLGAVLNRVELERNAYYYSSYYRREYVQYYQRAR